MRRYFILDFGASQLQTHHSRVIQGFLELTEELHAQCRILLPIGSEVDFGNHVKVKKVLIPSYHPVSFKIYRVKTWVPSGVGKLYRITSQTRTHAFTSKFLSWVAVRFAYLSIRKDLKASPNSMLIFPTACPVSFEFAKYLETKKISATTLLRLTNTAEKRGFHASNFKLKNSLVLLSQTKYINAKFAYEMPEYKSYLDIPEVSMYYSPTPPCREVFTRSNIPRKLRVGFVGMAQTHKGIDNIMDIVEGTSYPGGDAQIIWTIQCVENPEVSFLERAARHNVNLLFGRISEKEMKFELSKIDVICLPYKVESYLHSASALAYRAADNLITVVTMSGTAFANEISEYGIGYCVAGYDQFASVLKEIDNNDLPRDNLIAYNLMRKFVNLELLKA